VAQTAVAAHGLAEASQVGVDFGNNFDVPGMAAALFKDRASQGVCCLFTAFNALRNERLLKLQWYLRGRRGIIKAGTTYKKAIAVYQNDNIRVVILQRR
jgi:hypothetical protein